MSTQIPILALDPSRDVANLRHVQVSFATLRDLADAALPAASYTAEDVLAKVMSASVGAAIIDEDFEGAAPAGGRVDGTSPSLSTDWAAGGSKSMKFVLADTSSPSTTKCFWKYDADTTILDKHRYRVTFTMRFPAGAWATDTTTEGLWQSHSRPADGVTWLSPPLMLRCDNAKLNFRVRAPTNTDITDYGDLLDIVNTGQTVAVAIEYFYSTEADGWCKVWLDGNLVVDHTGPTGQVTPYGGFHAFGLYRWDGWPTSIKTRTLYIDDYYAEEMSASPLLPASSYTAADVLAKLKTVDTDTSGLNANTLQGATLAQLPKLATNNTFALGQTFGGATNSFGGDALAATTEVGINTAAGYQKSLAFKAGGLKRWVWYTAAGAEPGDDTGADIALASYDDDGVFIGNVLTGVRATRVIDFKVPPTVNGTPISAPGGDNSFAVAMAIALG